MVAFTNRIRLGLILFVGLTFVVNSLLIGLVIDRPITAKSLGTPVRSMTIWGQLFVRDPSTGRPVLYAGTHTGSGWSRLIRYDYIENKVEYYHIPGTKGAYGLCEGPDGKVYIGTVQDGRFFSFDPVTKKLTDLGYAAGESFVLTCHAGPDGRIYGATYPNAKIVVYDPVTGGIEDLGRMHPTESYCRDLAVADNGKIFCGIGARADIVVYDPVSLTRTSILPDKYKNNSFAYTMDSQDNIVYAFLHFDEIVLIFDAETYNLLEEIYHPEDGKGVYINRQISGGPVLITNHPNGTMIFNSTTRQLELYETPSYSNYDPQTGIACNGNSETFTAYNVTNGSILGTVDVRKDGDGMSIFSLGTGPDGNIYGGVYNLLHLFRYIPDNDTMQDLGIPIPGASGEFYSFLSFGEKLYMASYTYAILTVYDPAEPWNPGTSNTSNPRKIGPVGEEQYRPPALVGGSDGRVYIGSVAMYGKLGGALSIYDPFNDSFEVHRHIIPNQSIVSLAPSVDGSVIYGGSSIHGDNVATVEQEARFFAWDTVRGNKTVDILPVPGEDEISALVTAPDGKVHGCAGDMLFVFDPVSSTVIHRQASPVGRVKQMILWDDGRIYGISSEFLFRMEPFDGYDTVNVEFLYTGGAALALDNEGHVYFGSGSDVYLLENFRAKN